MERTKQKMKEASLILYMFDLKEESVDEIQAEIKKLNKLGIPYIKVANKSDLASGEVINALKTDREFIFISAKGRENLDQLKTRIIEKVNLEGFRTGDPIVTNLRHYESLYNAEKSLREVLSGISNGISDDLLGNIFSKFCIGK